MKAKENIGKKLVSDMIEDIMYGWPPDCNGILYQPERPQMICSVENAESDSENSRLVE